MASCNGCGEALGFKKYRFNKLWKIGGYYCKNCMVKVGENWERNTTFGPLRFNHGKNITDSLKVQTRFGSYVYTDAIALYGFGHFTFKSYFHGYIYSRIVNQPELFKALVEKAQSAN